MELPHSHCRFAECHQLDFLPIECISCHELFCKIHAKADDHNCEKVNENILSKDDVANLDGPTSFPCSIELCKGRELTPIKCDDCQIQFCLKHRLPVDHGCECIKVEEKSEFHGLTSQQKVEKITGKTLSNEKSSGRVGKKSTKTSNKVLEMKLKMKAKGETSISVEERVYFDVHIEVPGHSIKSLPLYFSKKFTVGRIIDLIAKYAKLKNENHIATARKLRVYLTDGEYFPVDVKLANLLCDNTNELCNFGQFRIEYV